MLIEYIEHLRTRPLHVRRRAAFIASASITAFVALLWGLTLPATIGSLSIELGDEHTAQLGEILREDTSKLQGFIDMQETFKGMVPETATPEPYVQPTSSIFATTTLVEPEPKARTIIIATSSSETTR